MKGRNSKNHVCQVVHHAKIAGTEKHVLLLSSKTNKELFKTHVCVLEDGDLVRELRNRELKVSCIPKSHSVFHFIKLIIFFLKYKFDIVHCHSGGYACIAAKLAGIKHIVHTKHGIGFTPEELKNRSFIRKLRDFIIDRCVQSYIALTSRDRYIMTDILRIDGSKISIINNGIDPSFSRDLEALPKRHPTIGVVGRLTHQKGIDYLIKAIPIVARRFPKLTVLIVGSGEQEAVLKDLAYELGVSEKVQFLGYRKKIANFINRMDIFILPSVWEGFPYVLLEAMLLRKPIIATDIFGVSEIIENGKSGILVRPRDSESIAKAIDDLLSNKEKALRLGVNAYRRVIRYYTLDKTIVKTEELYKSIAR